MSAWRDHLNEAEKVRLAEIAQATGKLAEERAKIYRRAKQRAFRAGQKEKAA